MLGGQMYRQSPTLKFWDRTVPRSSYISGHDSAPLLTQELVIWNHFKA